MTAPPLAAGSLDVAGVSSARLDTGTPVGAAAPPVLVLHALVVDREDRPCCTRAA